MKEGTPIIVKWIDAEENSKWMSSKEAEEYPPVKCITIGFFLNKDKKVLRLYTTIAQDGEKNVIVIPWTWKTEIIKIKLKGF